VCKHRVYVLSLGRSPTPLSVPSFRLLSAAYPIRSKQPQVGRREVSQGRIDLPCIHSSQLPECLGVAGSYSPICRKGDLNFRLLDTAGSFLWRKVGRVQHGRSNALPEILAGGSIDDRPWTICSPNTLASSCAIVMAPMKSRKLLVLKLYR